MFRILAVLCLVAASTFGMEKGVRVTFGVDPSQIGVSTFTPMPETKQEAIDNGWIEKTKPSGPAGYEKLTLMCPQGDNLLCFFFDELGKFIGYQIAIDNRRFTNQAFDWSVSGFKNWTVDENGEMITFYVTSVFLASPEYLAKDPAARALERDETKILQDSAIYLTGFNGNLVRVSTNTTQMDCEGVFTKQGCMKAMGLHYYYKMTKTLKCGAETILTYFILVHDNQIVGIGFMLPGKYTITTGHKDRFERPPKAVVNMIVPNGPPCLGEYADEGILTIHFYFVNKPYNIPCP